jgi:carbon storage regulator
MLVLSRKCGEQICMPGCDLVVTVLGVSGNRVRLGFTAPDDVAVYREEVWSRITEEADKVLASQPHHEMLLAR